MTEEEATLERTTHRETPLTRLALWIGGSALLGSVALVLWNRRFLRTLQEAAHDATDKVRVHDDDGIY